MYLEKLFFEFIVAEEKKKNKGVKCKVLAKKEVFHMPVVYLTETQARESSVTQVFKTAIIKQNTDQKALAKKIGMKYSTLHKRIHMPETATLGELWKIMDGLGIPEEERLKIVR